MAAEDEQGERRGAAGGRQARGAGGVRRRNVHDENDDDDFGFVQHMARQQRQADPDNEESDGEPDELDLDRLAAEGVGKKKLAKLAAKAEKRAVREAELAEREERKRRQEEKERKLDEEREQERLAEQEEEERLKKEREEKERREYEQYLEMKKAFAVDDEGQEALDSEQSSNLLQEFVDYVKRTKVVNLDELASHFRLRTEEAVNRVTELLASGQLTGVSDDRGKFIYITEEEMREVARYVDMRGRVSITQLAEASSNLIKLDGAVD